MRKFYSLLLTVFLTSVLNAQTGTKISGSITDPDGNPLNGATLTLLLAKDSSLAKLAVSDKNGNYEFVNIKPGNYFISATSVGFAKTNTKTLTLTDQPLDLQAMAMAPKTTNLAEVQVEVKRPFVETKLDRTVVNVEASPSSAGSTALEILEKSPGIMVNSDGVISLRGKQGVIVQIDGKPTFLSPTDLANVLKNMPASQLDQVEIMTNPSSKYDASGNSGIINLKTKKTKATGFNGSITLGATTSIYDRDGKTHLNPKSQNSFNFNYKRNKVNLFGNYNPNYFRGMNTMEINSKQIDSKTGDLKGYTDQVTKFEFGNNNHTLKIGMDWYANKKDVFGIVASGFMFDGHPTPVTIADDKDLNYQMRARLISKTENNTSLKNFTGNLNWKHSYKTSGHELSADLDYVHYSNQSDMTLVTDIYNGNLDFQFQSQLRGHIPSSIDIVSFKTDYSRPYKGGRLDVGAKTSFVTNDNLVNYDNYNGSTWVRNEIRSNHFIYKENINAAYVSANKQIKKWTMQAGLRVENTVGEGNQITKSSKFNRDTTNLFPTAFVSYVANKKNNLTLSYGRRISRPNYQDLNPFVFFLDTLSYRQGNIYLQPQYTHNLEMSHAFMGKYITTFAYNNTDNVISQIIKPDTLSGGKKRFLTPDNVAKLRNMSLSLTLPITVTKWWNLNYFTTIFNNHYTGQYDTIMIDMQYTSFMMNMTNVFTISKGFTAELGGFYRHNNVDQLTRTEPMYNMSVAAQKTIIAGKGTIRLAIRDPFAWQRFEGYNKYGYIDMRFKNRPDTRQVSATFTYRFSKGQNVSQRKRAAASQEEQNRAGGGGVQQ
jgi:iron complex outermembrane receptor protein